MNDRIVVFKTNFDFFAFDKLGKMLPIIHFLIKFESVVELIHLKFVRIVSLEDLSVDPAVGEVTLGISDFVS